MRVIALLLASLASALAADSVGTKDIHPFRASDLVQFHRLSRPVPSNDGRHALFTSSRYSATDNKTKRSLWLLRLEDDSVVHLSHDVIANPLWLSDTLVGGLSSSQLWCADVKDVLENSTDVAAMPIFQQLTTYPVPIGNVKCHAVSAQCAFTAEVYADGSMDTAAETAKRESERLDSAMVWDELFVRHWDVYVTPQLHNNLFVVKTKFNRDKPELDGEAINIMPGKGLETPVPPFGDTDAFEFSPDGKEIAFSSRTAQHSASAWNTNIAIYVVPTDGSSEPQPVSSTTGTNQNPRYSPDGKYLAWLSMKTPQYEADRLRILLHDRAAKTTSELAKNWALSAESLTWTSDSSTLLLTAQEKGHVRIFSINAHEDTKLKKNIPRRVLKKHTNGGLSIVGHTLFFEQSSVVAPTEIFTLDLNNVEKGARQRTATNAELLLRTLRSEVEEFWFTGARGEKVQGHIYKPVNFRTQNLYPVAFLIHGGPEGAWNDGWSYRWNPQVFTGAGYVVVTVNFHGSTGYGAKFTRSILKHWGDRPYRDLMKGLTHVLKTYPYVDKRRVAALGASYGGYMINWLNGHATDAFTCLTNHDGMFDTMATAYATDELWFNESEFGGPAYKSSARPIYDKFNPANYVKRWRTPTLIIHGAQDFRLPVTEGIATFTALQRRGIDSRLVIFPDENHWVLKPANSLRWYEEVLSWLAVYNGPAAPGTSGEMRWVGMEIEDDEAVSAADSEEGDVEAIEDEDRNEPIAEEMMDPAEEAVVSPFQRLIVQHAEQAFSS
ncbi:hypothetical protein HDU87_008522 [Geranomyces variabilis]|uniref:Dipeptidyl-peptidase V n=1 Tax=Geranomyces variabilis TaxID=109894 RepID=A0AAD5XSI0_9FUNG|nr:hypothetical protein HDU87_008522 [Geranomyces variabilis]